MNKYTSKLPKQELDKIFFRVKTAFYRNQQMFLNNSMDIDDLMQVIMFTVWKLEQKYGDKPMKERLKCIHSTISRKLGNLKKDAFMGQIYCIPDVDTEFWNKFTVDPELFNPEELKLILSEKEYQVVIERVINQGSFSKVGVAVGVSKGRAAILYHRAIKKLREKLTVDDFR